MKVLIITYYWPPAGGSGVQRWLKFVKYLPEFGIEPVVYCPENANYEAVDESLVNEIPDTIEIIKHKIVEPNSILKKKNVATASVKKNPSFFQKALQYIRGNYFIPDARKFWINPSVNYLNTYLKSNPVDVIISTGPPHSIHLIAMKLKQQHNIKWLADFRDPMSNLFYNDSLMLSAKAKRKLQQIEENIIQTADEVITVSESIQKEFQLLRKNVHVISNGYDDEVMIDKTLINLDKKFSITHIGLLPFQSNPKLLWKVLADLCKENLDFAEDLELKLVGNVSNDVSIEIENQGLGEQLQLSSYIPHQEAIQLQKESQVLLLCIPNVKGSEGIITGKLFEYITADRPILMMGPKKGDAAKIIEETKTGFVCDFEDYSNLKSVILNLYSAYKSGTLEVEAENKAAYHRKRLTQGLATILKNI